MDGPWIIKYWETRGIFVAKNPIDTNRPDGYLWDGGPQQGGTFYSRSDWEATLKEAREAVARKRESRIKSLEARLAKIRALDPHSLGEN